jgi:hypothetical protein
MFRFSIRDVLWLTVLAALIVAWLLDRRELIRVHYNEVDILNRQLIEAITRAEQANIRWKVGWELDPELSTDSKPRRNGALMETDIASPGLDSAP